MKPIDKIVIWLAGTIILLCITLITMIPMVFIGALFFGLGGGFILGIMEDDKE